MTTGRINQVTVPVARCAYHHATVTLGQHHNRSGSQAHFRATHEMYEKVRACRFSTDGISMLSAVWKRQKFCQRSEASLIKLITWISDPQTESRRIPFIASKCGSSSFTRYDLVNYVIIAFRIATPRHPRMYPQHCRYYT